MTNTDILITFGATIAGVIFSFSLWFGGTCFLKWLENRKTLKSMKREIQDEMQFSIMQLTTMAKNIQDKLTSGGDVPLFLPRLKYLNSSHIISSGEIRLLHNRNKQQLVLYMTSTCESCNQFLNNTESLLNTLLLRQDGMTWVKYRLERLIIDLNDKKDILTKFVSEFLNEKT